MLYRLFLLLAFTATSFTSFSQGPPSNFDIVDFNKKAATAEWLSYYDKLAWHSTDLLQELGTEEEFKQLGSEWFCYQDEKEAWHVTYGSFEEDKYKAVFHFILNEEAKLERTDAPVAEEISTPICRALKASFKSMLEQLEEGDMQPIRMNHYVQQGEKGITVYIFPAFQPNGTAVYGAEFIYNFDKTGQNLRSKTEYMQDGFYGFKADVKETAKLDYTDLEKPTLGSIFFCVYYAPYFDSIILYTNQGFHSLILDDKGSGSWMHVPKPPEKEEATEERGKKAPKKSKKKGKKGI